MVILAALPGMVRELLVTGKLAKPGNFTASVNFLGYRIRKVGLGGAVHRTLTLKQLLENLLQSLQDVGDCNVSKPFLEQDDITMPAFAMGGALVIQTGEVIVT